MTSTDTGQKAEAAARTYLTMRGYKIIVHNYRRPRCEIDIVAEKDGVVFMVEVKYRHSDQQGGGLDYITTTKLRQMHFAAETWVDDYKWDGQYRLAAVELEGDDFTVISFIDDIF